MHRPIGKIEVEPPIVCQGVANTHPFLLPIETMDGIPLMGEEVFHWRMKGGESLFLEPLEVSGKSGLQLFQKRGAVPGAACLVPQGGGRLIDPLQIELLHIHIDADAEKDMDEGLMENCLA